uniref:dUTPase-like domain-containing protein n=1 Tax=Equus caballus TaxID=9796 RepID=A0A9L0RJZ5_HORSE
LIQILVLGVVLEEQIFKEVLVPKAETLLLGDTKRIPLNWTLRLPHSPFGLLTPLNQQAKKRVTVLVGMLDPDYQGEIGLVLHNGGKEEFVWNRRDPLECLLLSIIMPYD